METGKPGSLRAAQKDLTRQRIVAALSELIEQDHPLEVSMSAVAARAGVSEPTLYRHFPTKRDLFGAMATEQFKTVTAGIAPASLDELATAIHTVFARSADMEATVRWTIAAPDTEHVPRPNSAARLDMLRTALGDAITSRSPDDAEKLLRGALLLTSPMTLLYWQDYLGLGVDEAADTAIWLLRELAATT